MALQQRIKEDKLTKKLVAIILCILLGVQPAKADLWGGDVAVLVQILANALKQLTELKAIVDTGQDTLGLMRDINRGINEALGVIRTVAPYLDPKLFKELKKFEDVLGKIEELYGPVLDSADAGAQSNTDQAVAEAISLNNEIFDYTKEIDKIGENIKAYSHQVSPGGAQKLTAESMGIMLHVLNQQLRAQATGLKLQAQIAAQSNKKEKDSTSQYFREIEQLQIEVKDREFNFERPRF